ncbi:MAG: hypothetical protein CMP48_18675 [Rickettsiales bacterium]|nr:hypothetical protein [Rickettsiales bacterium]
MKYWIFLTILFCTQSVFSQRFLVKLKQKDVFIANEDISFQAFLTESYPYSPINQEEIIKAEIKDQNGKLLIENLFYLKNGYLENSLSIPEKFKSGTYKLTLSLLSNPAMSNSFELPLIDFSDLSETYFEVVQLNVGSQSKCLSRTYIDDNRIAINTADLENQVATIKIQNDQLELLFQKSLLISDSITYFETSTELENQSLITIELYNSTQNLIHREKQFIEVPKNLDVFTKLTYQNRLEFLKELEYSGVVYDNCIPTWSQEATEETKPFRIQGELVDVENPENYFISFFSEPAIINYSRVTEDGLFEIDSFNVLDNSKLSINLIERSTFQKIDNFNYTLLYKPFVIEEENYGFNPKPLPIEIKKDILSLKETIAETYFGSSNVDKAIVETQLVPDEEYDPSEYPSYENMAVTIKELVGKKKMRKQKGVYSIYLLNRFNNMFFNRSPLIIVDDMVGVSLEELWTINPATVTGIEVFHNSVSNIKTFGELATYGVIKVNTNGNKFNQSITIDGVD